ncbi:MAG: HD domain-containing protein [Candidatus Omnitrophica bacterium]|nr:HD domain-containing protein [Candidatus Omnitrophota bacterium]
MATKLTASSLESVLNFISEAGTLKRVSRSGWSVVGVSEKESVADHSFRCAVIAYALARLEGADALAVLLMSLFGDIHEARITDLHKMAQRYIDLTPAENIAFGEQVARLPFTIKSELKLSRKEYLAQNTKASLIARDADILECLLQAKEYFEFGYSQAASFMKKAPRYLVTKSAKALWRKAKKTHLNDWWKNLASFKR